MVPYNSAIVVLFFANKVAKVQHSMFIRLSYPVQGHYNTFHRRR